MDGFHRQILPPILPPHSSCPLFSCSSLLPVQLTTVPAICSAHSLQFCNLFSFTTARLYSLFSSPLWLQAAQLTACNSAVCSVSPLLVPTHCSAHHCASHLLSLQIVILQSVQSHHCSFLALCSAHHCFCHLLSSQIVILQSVQFHHCSSLLSVQLTTVPAIWSAHRL